MRSQVVFQDFQFLYDSDINQNIKGGDKVHHILSDFMFNLLHRTFLSIGLHLGVSFSFNISQPFFE